MIEFETARSIILAAARPTAAEWVSLAHAADRYLAGDVRARTPIPRFAASAVDGYAVRCRDVRNASPQSPATLALAGTTRAGAVSSAALAAGTTVHVLTGAPLPDGTEAVVMQEHVRRRGASRVDVRRAAARGDGVRPAGAEFAEGAHVLDAGTRVTPPVAGLLATLGCAKVRVHRVPRVAIVVTGDEVRPLGSRLEPGQIYDSNAHMLGAALRAMGIEPVAVTHAPDDAAATRRALGAALRRADVLLTSGGVSVGAYDFVKDTLRALGVRARFWGVAQKPGKPFYFGTSGRRLVFGLPGNPVSALVTFQTLVQPALRKMLGAARDVPLLRTAVLDEPVRKSAGRLEFVRGRLGADHGGVLHVVPVGSRESHMLGGLAAADCLILLPLTWRDAKAGSVVEVMELVW